MPDINASIKLLERYSYGERQFSKIQLEKANFESVVLSDIDLRRAKLDHATFTKADLSKADLRKASLVRANFCQVNLKGANLTGANLTGANLTGANLTGASFCQANLSGANLSIVRLNKKGSTKEDMPNFCQANLSGAFFLGVDLTAIKLEGSFYDNATRFPVEFDPISTGMLKECTVLNECTVESLVAQFNHLCQCSNKYLGGMMTAKYFYESRPELNWLAMFTIDDFGKITFQGDFSDSINSEQLHLYQQWMNSFSLSCSRIIKDFNKLVSVS